MSYYCSCKKCGGNAKECVGDMYPGVYFEPITKLEQSHQTSEAVVTLNNLLNAAVELAEACRANCATICVCSPEYKTRGKQDPACEFCEIGKFVLPLANKILAGI